MLPSLLNTRLTRLMMALDAPVFSIDLGIDALVRQQFCNVVALLHCTKLCIAAYVLQKTVALLRRFQPEHGFVQAGFSGRVDLWP